MIKNKKIKFKAIYKNKLLILGIFLFFILFYFFSFFSIQFSIPKQSLKEEKNKALTRLENQINKRVNLRELDLRIITNKT